MSIFYEIEFAKYILPYPVNAAIGENISTGAAVAQYGMKWNNELFDAINSIIDESKESVAKKVMNEANYLVNAGYVSPSNMFSDYETVQIAIGAGIKAASIGCTIDKEGNVYATMAFAPGVSIGGHITVGAGFLSRITSFTFCARTSFTLYASTSFTNFFLLKL